MGIVQLTNGELMLSIVGPTGPAGATGPSAGPTGPTGPGGGATSFLPSGGDDATALNALMATTSGAGGGVIKLRGGYIIGSALAIPSNVTLDGDHAATITMGGVLFRAFTMVSVTNAHLRNIIFDLTSSTALSGFVGLLQGATNCDVTGCTFIHIKGEIDLTGGTTSCRIDCNIFTTSLQNAVRLDGAAYCSASYNVVSDCTQFGIFGTAGAHHNLLIGNQTLHNGLELIGLQYDCHDNRIIGNHAEGTGDNGISVTGRDNVVANNICRANAFNGIGVYGSHNTVVGNECVSNGQHSLIDPTQTYAGIQIQSAFGGTAQYNTVTGNAADDDQTVMTQNEGIHLNGTRLYVLWDIGIVITPGTYCSNGSNIYLSAAGGTTGASPPVHTSGTVSDGGVLWQYINTFASATREPIGCAVGPNSADRSISGLGTRDTTTNNYNVVIARSYMRVADIQAAIGQRYDAAGVVRHMPPWAAGVARTYGQMVYTTLGHTYRVVNTGGTTSVEPTHTVGKVTGADGITWLLLVQNSREYPTLPMTDSTVSIDAVMGLGQIDQAGVFTKLISGSGDPNGVVSAPKGSLFLRSDGGAGSTFYVREAASLTTWQAK